MWYVLNENPRVGISQGIMEQLARGIQNRYYHPTIEDVEYEDLSNEIDNEPCYN